MRAVWQRRDAWVLQSVVYARPGGNLRTVIANADAINDEIPTREQLERAVQLLQAAGLVTTDGTRVRAKRAGRRVVRRSYSGWQDTIRSIAPRVHSTLQDTVPYPAQPGPWRLSDTDWQAAYDAYRPAASSR